MVASTSPPHFGVLHLNSLQGQMGREDVRKPARRHGSSPALQRLSMAQNSRVPSGVPSTGQEPWGYLLPCQSNPWSVEALTGELVSSAETQVLLGPRGAESAFNDPLRVGALRGKRHKSWHFVQLTDGRSRASSHRWTGAPSAGSGEALPFGNTSHFLCWCFKDFTGIWKHPHLHRGTGTSVLKS